MFILNLFMENVILQEKYFFTFIVVNKLFSSFVPYIIRKYLFATVNGKMCHLRHTFL